MPDSDAALVARALAGDADGFEMLVRRHFRAAYAVALALTREPADADDVCQDAFVRAWERLADCREPDRFPAWLAQIVRNRARNRLAYFRVRRALPIGAAEERAGGASPHADAEREELRRALLAALGGLPRIQREVVMLHDLEGMKHGEIAELVGCSEGMSRRHLSDARRVLRLRLADRYRGETTMDERPIDLRPLDPDEDPWRQDRVVGAAMARVRALRREPASAPGWLGWLDWWRPAAAFAGLVIAASATVIASAPAARRAETPGVAAAGVPAPVAEWMARDRLPAAAEVFAAMQGYP